MLMIDVDGVGKDFIDGVKFVLRERKREREKYRFLIFFSRIVRFFSSVDFYL